MRSRDTKAPTVVAVVAALAALTGCGTDQGRVEAAEIDGPPRQVVVDTDLAADDLVALAFLLSSPRVEVRAITVSGTGEVRCPAGLRVAEGLLALTGAEGIPVACGRSTPLAGDHAFPAEWRDASDDAWGVDLPAGRSTGPAVSAADLLVRTLDQDTTLLALAPLTNVAQAFRADPGLPGRVGSAVVMGGAVGVGGNVFLPGAESPTAEWNMYVDPVAAAEVLGSGVSTTLVGLDATNQAPITDDFVESLRSGERTEAADLVGDLLAGNPMVASGEAFFWDPLAAAVVVDPGLVETEELRIVVGTGEDADSGRTVEDADGAPVAVALETDPEALEALLVQTLS